MRPIKNRGLSLIELLLSITIVAILANIAIPVSEATIKNRRENLLFENLMTIRKAIDRYYVDKNKLSPKPKEWQKYPKSLEELVQKKYLRKIPTDPFTGKASYKIIYYRELPTPAGVFDVKSLCNELSSKGDLYSSW